MTKRTGRIRSIKLNVKEREIVYVQQVTSFRLISRQFDAETEYGITGYGSETITMARGCGIQCKYIFDGKKPLWKLNRSNQIHQAWTDSIEKRKAWVKWFLVEIANKMFEELSGGF